MRDGDRHGRTGGKQFYRLFEDIGGAKPLVLGFDLSLDIDPGDSVAAEDEGVHLDAAPTNP